MLDRHKALPWATAGIVAASFVVPALGVYRVIALTPTAAHIVPAVVASVLLLPVQLWLVLNAARGRSAAVHRWALAAMAVVILLLLPVTGPQWLGALFPLSALVLVVMPRPYAIVTFAALVVLPIPYAYSVGAPADAGYFAFGTLMYGLGVALPIWLLAAIREWHEARLALATDAVVLERIRIDGELRPIVGSALTTIAERGQAASERTLDDPAAAERQLRALVDGSRHALSDVRRLVRSYQTVSVRSELWAAVHLLDAVGIRAELRLPAADLPLRLDEHERAELQARVATVLAAADKVVRCIVTATLADGRLRLDVLAYDLNGQPMEVGAV